MGRGGPEQNQNWKKRFRKKEGGGRRPTGIERIISNQQKAGNPAGVTNEKRIGKLLGKSTMLSSFPNEVTERTAPAATAQFPGPNTGKQFICPLITLLLAYHSPLLLLGLSNREMYVLYVRSTY